MTRAELLKFLRQHRLGVLSTVSAAGEPEAAVVGVAFTDELEIVFDTLETTRKAVNLRRSLKIAFVVGWDEEITAQLEGVARATRRRARTIEGSVFSGLLGRARAAALEGHHVFPRAAALGPL
jgi:general stress protein 26